MKMTSEVIKELQALVAQHGDLPFVRYQQEDGGGPYSDFGHDPYVTARVERFEPTKSAQLDCINGQWVRRPVPGIAEDAPVICLTVE